MAAMECMTCGGRVRYNGKYVKSRDPYIATVYYVCPACGTRLSMHHSMEVIESPDSPEDVFRRVLKDLSSLDRARLEVVRSSVAQMIS